MAKRYQNYTEQVVERALREYLKSEDDLCDCELCFADMAAAALNQLRPRYYTSQRGQAFMAWEDESGQIVAEVVAAIRRAAERVRENPRHLV